MADVKICFLSKGLYWINLALDEDKWRAVMNKVLFTK